MPKTTIVLTYPGSSHEFPTGITGAEVAASIGKRLATDAIALKLDGQLQDLSRPITKDASFAVVTPKTREGKLDEDALRCIRHTAEHIATEAICRLWPETKLVYGPVIDEGFYADIDLDHKISVDEFPMIEAEMAKIIADNRPLTRYEMPRAEALKKLEHEGNPYKLDNAKNADSDTLSFYVTGDKVGEDFEDLCMGPHAPSTGRVAAFKLTAVAGAYLHGDQTQKQLQRIYGTAFHDRRELDAHLARIAEAKKRDHRIIGQQLDLFHQQEEAPGSVFWHDKGWTLWRIVENYIRDTLRKAGYIEVRTPQLLDRALWEKSGHWEKYKELMFITESEKHTFAVKPMNCPCHIQIFNQGVKSYRQLPLRMAEFGACHRNEPGGTLHGIMRVRAFTQDDAHIFCTEDQIASEVAEFVRILRKVYADFGFTDVVVKLATRPEKRIGSDSSWDRTEKALADAMQLIGMQYDLNPGEGAFYGPKLEFDISDALGRLWQLGTIQVDTNLPERLGARYIGEDNSEHVPVMLHRAILGSLERFLGILIEHYAGAFPLWLSPVQVCVASITDKQEETGWRVANELRTAGLRIQTDFRNMTINAKVAESESAKIPYLLVIGEREAASNTVAVRARGRKNLGAMSVAGFVTLVQKDWPPSLESIP